MSKEIKTILDMLLHQQDSWKWRLLRHWNEIMGNLQEHVILQKIEQDRLILCVSNACWLHELYLLSDVLKERINQKLDQPYIKALRFILKSSAPEKKRAQRNSRSISTRTIELNIQEQARLNTITDPELRHALRSFLIRCYRERT